MIEDPSAVHVQGQLALTLLAVDPVGLGGFHLRSRAGPIRDTFTRPFKSLFPNARRISPSISDIQLFGGVDVGETLTHGRVVLAQGLLETPGPIILTMAERCEPGLAARLAQTLDSQSGHCLLLLDEGADGQRAFRFIKGPIFTSLLMADEINRAAPKVQGALLEAMQERKVTIDGDPYALNDRFTVIATQNPIEQQGTYPLPEAQLDRFLFKHVLAYPSRDEELAIVSAHGNRTGMKSTTAFGVDAVVTAEQLSEAVAAVSGVRVQDDVVAYIVDIVRLTRETPALSHGASPRAAAAIAAAARAKAALDVMVAPYPHEGFLGSAMTNGMVRVMIANDPGLDTILGINSGGRGRWRAN